MSTISPTSTLSSLPTINSSDGGGGGRSASYFFGFLITFAVLLVLFIMIGLISRQRLLARRRAAVAMGLDIGREDPWMFGPREHRVGEESRRVRPVYIERWVDEKKDINVEDVSTGPETGKWISIVPLSATLALPEREVKPEIADDEPKTVRRSSISTISSWFSGFSTTKDTGAVQDIEPAHVPKEELYDPEAEIDVVVMIAMPHSPDKQGYEFGFASVPLTPDKTLLETHNDNVTP